MKTFFSSNVYAFILRPPPDKDEVNPDGCFYFKNKANLNLEHADALNVLNVYIFSWLGHYRIKHTCDFVIINDPVSDSGWKVRSVCYGLPCKFYNIIIFISSVSGMICE